MKRASLIASVLLLFGLNGQFRAAEIIYGVANPTIEMNSGLNSYSPGSVAAASSFMLAQDSILTDVHWWGFYGPDWNENNNDNFVLVLYPDTSGLPDASTPTPLVLQGTPSRSDDQDIYKYEVLVDPVSLSAGVTYWLSIVNDILDEEGIWLWATTNSNTNSNAEIESGDWAPSGNVLQLAFYLTGTLDDGNGNGNGNGSGGDPSPVPEPASLLLFGLTTLAVAGGYSWQRCRRAAA